jgi:pimeloyl-ACP methyl ester carboxylesterase
MTVMTAPPAELVGLGRQVDLDTQRGRLVGIRSGSPDGPKLLALHGWLDNAASFIPLQRELAAFDLVALDLPGHGASAHRAAGYDYVFVDWIHDVLDVLDALGWPRAMLLGHSMGGAIASMVAAATPQRVERLALIEALGPISGKPEEAGERLQKAVLARRALEARAAAPVFPRLPGERAPRAPGAMSSVEAALAARLAATPMAPDCAEMIVRRNLRIAGRGVAWRSDPRLMLPGHIRTDEAVIQDWLRHIECPTLVIAADPAPPYFAPAVRDARLAQLRGARVEVVAGGHHLHMEQPAIVGALLRDFLTA